MNGNGTVTKLRSQPLLLFLIGITGLGAALILLVTVVTTLPGSVLQQIVAMMAGTGILVTLVSFIVYKSGALYYLRSLRWLLLMIVACTVAVVLLNLWLLSHLMFFNSVYLPVVTVMMFFAGLAAISFGYFVSRAMTDRLFMLTDATAQLASGNLDLQLPVRGNDEIAALTGRFNATVRDLRAVDEEKRRLEQTRRDLIAWVSHDLRTPLASMRVMLEALNDGIISDQATQTRYVQSSLSEIQHLSQLIDDLFEMAQLDVGHHDLHLMETPLGDLISDTLGGMLAKANHRNITLHGEILDDIDLVTIAPDKIQRVLKNLLDNAIKYTPPGQRVAIYARRKDANSIQIDVENSGVTIAPEILPNLFESFYRGERSRANTDDERGTGLGLAIARGFVEAHGGRIWAESSASQGTTFSFTLPIRSLAKAH